MKTHPYKVDCTKYEVITCYSEGKTEFSKALRAVEVDKSRDKVHRMISE